MSIAVLPFESKGIGRSLGDIDLLDKLITAFVNLGRFKVVERAQLEKILEEQKLGLSGIIDARTAARIGRGLGVDAVVTGSITQSGQSVTIDARLIDAETAAILTARDAFSSALSLASLTRMITEAAQKIRDDLPILNGYVIRVDGNKLTLDKGFTDGLKKGMKCIVYREGAPIIHPVTGEFLGKTIEEICEVRVLEVLNNYSIADVTRTIQSSPQIKDRFVTK
ncbi:MAG: hypothetical protein D6715_11765 [Calditrichaeota bacterium]|nr:MAG: hypothetical protein D6715_11765 [Calditrichota bacterium]